MAVASILDYVIAFSAVFVPVVILLAVTVPFLCSVDNHDDFLSSLCAHVRDEHDLADCVNDAGRSCACKQCDEQAENPLLFLSAFGVEQAGVVSLLNGALDWFHSILRFCAAFLTGFWALCCLLVEPGLGSNDGFTFSEIYP